jgi:hypothetical protein
MVVTYIIKKYKSELITWFSARPIWIIPLGLWTSSYGFFSYSSHPKKYEESWPWLLQVAFVDKSFIFCVIFEVVVKEYKEKKKECLGEKDGYSFFRWMKCFEDELVWRSSEVGVIYL